MALNLQQLRAGSAVNHLAVVVSTKEELTTLNSVKERGSHGALRSQLSTFRLRRPQPDEMRSIFAHLFVLTLSTS